MFSQRSGRPRTPHALSEQLAKLPPARFDLCGSNPSRAGLELPAALLQALTRALADAKAYAPEPFGLVTAREAVARHFTQARALTSAPPSADVILTASTSEAYSYLFKLLCDPSDEVLVPAPSYPLFEHLAELESVRATAYRLAYDGAWHIDLDSLKRAITPRSRAIIVVSPNNPTGQYVTQAEWAALAELGLPVISDEVFFEYPLATRACGAAAPNHCLSFSLGGLSKLLASPQLKLAWTIIDGPEAARVEARERLELIADTFLSVNTPVQQALPELLALAPEVNAVVGRRCRDNLAELRQRLASSALTALRVEGGWSAVVHFPDLTSEDELVVGLLREQSVLVQPGWFYDFDAAPFVVLSLLTEPSTFREGVARLVAHVDRL